MSPAPTKLSYSSPNLLLPHSCEEPTGLHKSVWPTPQKLENMGISKFSGNFLSLITVQSIIWTHIVVNQRSEWGLDAIWSLWMEEKIWRIMSWYKHCGSGNPSGESIPAVSEERCMKKSPNKSLIVKWWTRVSLAWKKQPVHACLLKYTFKMLLSLKYLENCCDTYISRSNSKPTFKITLFLLPFCPQPQNGDTGQWPHFSW